MIHENNSVFIYEKAGNIKRNLVIRYFQVSFR